MSSFLSSSARGCFLFGALLVGFFATFLGDRERFFGETEAFLATFLGETERFFTAVLAGSVSDSESLALAALPLAVRLAAAA